MMERRYILRTQRIGLRTWLDEDAEAFCELNADAEVMRYFPATLSKEESLNLFHRIRNVATTQGYGIYAADELETGACIGYVGFSSPKFETWFTPCIEILWRLQCKAWGKGYATEAARALLNYGFSQLAFKKVYAFTTVSNSASERVMQKCGMVKEGEFAHPLIADGHVLKQHVVYSINSP